MKTSNLNSFLLRACCTAFLALAMVIGTQNSTYGQTKAELRAAFQDALNKLPDAATTRKLRPGTQNLVNNTRALYQQGLGIETMSSAQENQLLNDLETNRQNLSTALEGKSCVQTCMDEREACILADCGEGTTFPCFCCIPCNLVWELCLFDCLVDIEIGIKVGGSQIGH